MIVSSRAKDDQTPDSDAHIESVLIDDILGIDAQAE